MRRPGHLGDLSDTWFAGLGFITPLDDHLVREREPTELWEMASKYNRSRGYRGNRLTPPVIADPAYSASHPTYRLMYLDQKYRNIPITKKTPVQYYTPPGLY